MTHLHALPTFALRPQRNDHFSHCCHWSQRKSIRTRIHITFEVIHFCLTSPAQVTLASPICISLGECDKSWSSKFTPEYERSGFVTFANVSNVCTLKTIRRMKPSQEKQSKNNYVFYVSSVCTLQAIRCVSKTKQWQKNTTKH